MSEITLRPARPSDAAALLGIYAPYVLKTAITYEYDVPTVENFTARIQGTLQKYPYLVAECDGSLLGYAYLSPLSERAAGAWAAETSIYVAENAHRMGVGRLLYEALEKVAASQGLVYLSARIAYSTDENDPYLSRNSIDFHAHMGYCRAGEYRRCGCKFGRWYSLVIMEKHLSLPESTPSPVIPFPALPTEALWAAGITA